MKIIYCHQYFRIPSMSGGTRSYEMAKRLVKKGHEVHMITSWQGETDIKGWFEEEIDGIHVHWLPVRYSNKMTYIERIKAFVHFATLAGFRAVSIGGDVVLATSTPLTIAIPGIFAAKKLDIPMVFEVRDLWPELPIAIGALKNPLTIYLAKKLERYAYNNSRRVIALSAGMADGVVKAGYPRSRVAEIPNSADLDLFGPENRIVEPNFFESLLKRKSNRIVLYPGTLGHINDVSYLVDIAEKVKSNGGDIDFVVIGDGVERHKVEQRARELGVWQANFHLFPSMPKSKLVSAFSEADIIASLFLPLKEMEPNSANKFFDALASAKPVLINYGGWQKRLIEEHKCGLVVDRDLESSALSLIAFLDDSEALQFASKSAYELAKSRFSRDRLAEQFEQVLIEAVAECRVKGAA